VAIKELLLVEIQGFGIGTCLAIPVVLGLLTQGERIKEF